MSEYTYCVSNGHDEAVGNAVACDSELVDNAGNSHKDHICRSCGEPLEECYGFCWSHCEDCDESMNYCDRDAGGEEHPTCDECGNCEFLCRDNGNCECDTPDKVEADALKFRVRFAAVEVDVQDIADPANLTERERANIAFTAASKIFYGGSAEKLLSVDLVREEVVT